MYEVYRRFGKVAAIRRLEDNTSIPICLENRDYVEFLKWHEKQPDDQKLNMELVTYNVRNLYNA